MEKREKMRIYGLAQLPWEGQAVLPAALARLVMYNTGLLGDRHRDQATANDSISN